MKPKSKSGRRQKGVQLVEVGLRDGLQNEDQNISVELKMEMAKRLVDCGVSRLELGAFVRADKIPQMAESKILVQQFLANKFKVTGSVLVPNERGMVEAIESGVKEVAVFVSSTESFSKKNINCTIKESFDRLKPVMALAKKHKIKVRGYLSVCFGCPYEGAVSSKQVVELAKTLVKIGCFEVSISDTIGVASPAQVKSLISLLRKQVPVKKLALHLHDTRGTALANIYQGYLQGIRVFDSSVGGLGGCPYAPGAAGNVATEDVVNMFQSMGVSTGLDLVKLIETSRWLNLKLQRKVVSKMSLAGVFIAKGAVN